MTGINEVARQIHENAVDHGWWDEERGFPEVLALIHSIFGLQFCSLLLSMMGVDSMLGSMIPTILLLVGIYGSYFLITYLCSRSILSEGMEDGGVQDF